MSTAFIFGFILLICFGMQYTWPVKYKGGGGKRK